MGRQQRLLRTRARLAGRRQSGHRPRLAAGRQLHPAGALRHPLQQPAQRRPQPASGRLAHRRADPHRGRRRPGHPAGRSGAGARARPRPSGGRRAAAVPAGRSRRAGGLHRLRDRRPGAAGSLAALHGRRRHLAGPARRHRRLVRHREGQDGPERVAVPRGVQQQRRTRRRGERSGHPLGHAPRQCPLDLRRLLRPGHGAHRSRVLLPRTREGRRRPADRPRRGQRLPRHRRPDRLGDQLLPRRRVLRRPEHGLLQAAVHQPGHRGDDQRPPHQRDRAGGRRRRVAGRDPVADRGHGLADQQRAGQLHPRRARGEVRPRHDAQRPHAHRLAAEQPGRPAARGFGLLHRGRLPRRRGGGHRAAVRAPDLRIRDRGRPGRRLGAAAGRLRPEHRAHRRRLACQGPAVGIDRRRPAAGRDRRLLPALGRGPGGSDGVAGHPGPRIGRTRRRARAAVRRQGRRLRRGGTDHQRRRDAARRRCPALGLRTGHHRQPGLRPRPRRGRDLHRRPWRRQLRTRPGHEDARRERGRHDPAGRQGLVQPGRRRLADRHQDRRRRVLPAGRPDRAAVRREPGRRDRRVPGGDLRLQQDDLVRHRGRRARLLRCEHPAADPDELGARLRRGRLHAADHDPDAQRRPVLPGPAARPVADHEEPWLHCGRRGRVAG